MTETPTRNPKATADKPSVVERRLARLVALARAADFWERLWRGLIPPLVVIGLFLCVSWLGLWLEVPHWARALGVVLFALLLVAACFGLRRLAPLSRQDALRRIDRSSGLTHRPAAVLDDRSATAGRDPSTDALWLLHQRRAEAEAKRMKAGAPAPRAVEIDRYALRAGVVVALVACALIAGPQRYARVAAAFDFGFGTASGPSYRLDAWIDPPPYTGKPPVLLELGTDKARDLDHPLKVTAPAGSTVIIRAAGGDPAEIETSGPLLAPAKKVDDKKADDKSGKPSEARQDPAPGGNETRLVLHGDSRLTLRHGGSLRGVFDLVAIPDKPPTIALREVPKFNVRGSLTLAYTTSDDYGVAKAEATFTDPRIDDETLQGPSLVPPPKMELSLPSMTNGIGNGDTTADLSDHPWAGAKVTMTLVARDDGGNEGRSEPVEITLPQKPFANPLARALVEQRRILVLDPGRRTEIGSALAALMIAPEVTGTTPSAYLGLRFALSSLTHADTNDKLREVADFLWSMALQLENGDLSDAEKALRNAEKELRDAIDRKASPEEIARLTQNLQAAMEKFLKELAQQQKKDDQQQTARNQGKAKSISPRDLQKLIDRLKEQMKSGNREEAKKALDELQDILENLKTAKRQKPDPQSRAMAEGLNQLDQAMRDQQDLRDETFKQGQQGGQQQGGEQQSKPQRDEGRNGQERSGENGDGQLNMPGRPGQGSRGAGQGQGSEGGQQPGMRPGGSLGERQRELADRLRQIQKRLKQAGEGEGELDEAGRNMKEAEEALRQGEGSNGQAVDAQGRALDAMRKGAKKLADSMQQQQGNEPGGQANGDSQQGHGSQNGQQSSDSDPLGRPRGGHSIDSMSKFNPLGVPAAQRAQSVLEELRRRLGDPSRNQEEIDYLERLLRSY